MTSSSSLLGSRGLLLPPAEAYGWADSLKYYQGAFGAGRSVHGTVRLVGRLRSAIDATHRIIACHERTGGVLYGYRLVSGNAANSISAYSGGAGGYVETPRYTFSGGDIGKIFVLHLVTDTVARLYIGGAEVGSGTAPVTVTDAGITGRLTLGMYIDGGFSSSPIGILNISVSPTALTAAQVVVDATTIMSRPRGLILPLMPGEDQRHVADDVLQVSSWVDRLGSVTLTETGDVSVSRVPV